MPSYLPAQNPFRTDFVKDQRTIRPLPPPGHRLDGREGEALSGVFAATKQTTVITLAGSAATGDVNTLTIIPERTATGSPWGDRIPELVIAFTVAGVETIAAVGEGIEARAAAITAISSLTDTSDYQPIKDFCTVTAVNEVITIITRDAGARFTYSWSSTGSTTETSVTTGDDDNELRVGTVCVVSSRAANGYPTIAAPSAGSAATAIFGVVKEGNGCKPAASGYAYKVYPMAWDVPVETWGPMTVYAEAACTVGASVYVRKTATGTEIAGAVNDAATTDTVQIHTITPTAAHSTLFQASIVVKNFFTGAITHQGQIQMTSDADATATEIVTGLKASLVDDNDELDGIVVGTGTTTLILTVAAGYVIEFISTAPGVLAEAATQAAASDHLLWTGAKFEQTNSSAGIAAISVPHP
jgi:hypothetical protein